MKFDKLRVVLAPGALAHVEKVISSLGRKCLQGSCVDPSITDDVDARPKIPCRTFLDLMLPRVGVVVVG